MGGNYGKSKFLDSCKDSLRLINFFNIVLETRPRFFRGFVFIQEFDRKHICAKRMCSCIL